jgi:hypothetical protein
MYVAGRLNVVGSRSKAEVKSRSIFRDDQTRSATTSSRTSNACLNNAETQEALQTHAVIMVSTVLDHKMTPCSHS